MAYCCSVGGKARALDRQETVDCLPQGLWSNCVEPNVAQDHFPGGCDGHGMLESQRYPEASDYWGAQVWRGARLQATGWGPEKP